MRLLIVEDDPSSALVLETHAAALGHACVHRGSAEAAWRLLRADTSVEVVLCDAHLPGAPGSALCARVQADLPRFVPVVVTGSAVDHAERVAALRAGAVAFLDKPVRREALELQLLAAERLVRLHRTIEAQQAELRAMVVRLHHSATRDVTTELPNRAAFEAAAARALVEARHLGRPLGVVLLDLDHFKACNDAWGHPAGDRTLRAAAQALAAACRRSDGLYRYGGEEFVLLLPGANRVTALEVAERLRAALIAARLPHPDGIVRLSAGVAALDPDAPQPMSTLIEAADRALYAAKQAGRDRVAG